MIISIFYQQQHQLYMKYHLTEGLTLIEIVIYVALLSVLMAGFLQFAITLHLNNIDLIHDIQNAYQK